MVNKLGIQEINMLIMDIEGYEYFALRGLENSLLDRAVKNLICEIHPDFIKEWNGLSENDVINLLSECGYKVNRIEKSVNSRPYHIHATPADH
jgi:hypothetical protein